MTTLNTYHDERETSKQFINNELLKSVHFLTMILG